MVKTARNGIKKKIQLLTLFSLGLLLPFGFTQTAEALSGSDFKAGDIIADTVFFNRDSMSQAQIQDFLNAKVPDCDTNGSKMHSSGQTRAAYGASKGYPAPYTCLKSYTQSIPSTSKDINGYCEAISGGTKSASQIIYDVSRACYINPQTLLVLLQKEQSLVTDEWPWPSQYRSATGYGCPDTAPCDSQYYGFYNQVYQAAKAFKRYAANPGNYSYRSGRDNTILYNPNSSCGSSTVYISNQATAGLYIYTPYRPNAAALNNLYGSGDGCSAYGNRNFWRMFNDWFGNTAQPFPPMDTPRWMQLNMTTTKRNVYSGTATDPTLNSGAQLRLVDKILIDGVWYLRTAYDSANNLGKGIPQSELSEIPYEDFFEPRYMVLTREAYKKNPRTRVDDKTSHFAANTTLKFSRKIKVDGEWLYQTEYDAAHGHDRAIIASHISDIKFDKLTDPRYMIIRSGSKLVDLRRNITLDTFASDTKAMVVDKAFLNGVWYFRVESDANAGNAYGIIANEIKEEVIADEFEVLPYLTIKLKSDTTKYNPETSSPIGSQNLTKNSLVKVARKLKTNNNLAYYQTLYDYNNNLLRGIPIDQADVMVGSFVNLDEPRYISTNKNTTKINLSTGELIGSTLASGTSLKFRTKTFIEGEWYLRSEFDTNNNLNYVIPIKDLDI